MKTEEVRKSIGHHIISTPEKENHSDSTFDCYLHRKWQIFGALDEG